MSVPRINYGPTIVPPAGLFTARDDDGNVIEGMTRDELITKLTDWRVANKRPVGDPEKDVDKQLTGQVGYSSPIPVSSIKDTPKPATMRLIDRVNGWVQNRIRNKAVQFVNQAEALKRAAICAQCPQNKNWQSSCATCNAESKRVIARDIVILSQNKQTPLHNRLEACNVTGQANKAAVFLTEESLRHRTNYMDKLPSFCWLKKLNG